MGLLVDGVWQDDVSRTKDGHFVRPAAQFRNWVTPDGSAGPSGDGGFPAEAGRYHLYVSLACPWAHRTIIMRSLQRLEHVIVMTVVDPVRDDRGLAFRDGPGYSSDPVNVFKFLSEAYSATDPSYDGRVTVP